MSDQRVSRWTDDGKHLTNEFTKHSAFNDLIHRLFDSDILPNTYKYKENEIFADAYVHERQYDYTSLDFDYSYLTVKYRYEDKLDSLFWDENYTSKLICILGPVGSGKTTFTEFYLHSYCPFHGRKPSHFDLKMFITFKGSIEDDGTDVYHHFFLLMKAEIENQCNQRGFDIEAALNSRTRVPSNLREWVWTALEETSNSSQIEFRYVVLFIDNIDQLGVRAQKKIIAEVQAILKNKSINIWKVIICMWPSTYEALLSPQFNLVRGAYPLPLGKLTADKLSQERSLSLKVKLASHIDVRLSRDATIFIENCFSLLSRKQSQILMHICNGDLRRFLRIVGDMIRSEKAYDIHKQYEQNISRSYEYEIIECMLCGTKQYFVHMPNKIGNIFMLGNNYIKPRDILIGYHALLYLKSGTDTPVTLEKCLLNLGYAPANIKRMNENLLAFNFVHEIPHSSFNPAIENKYDVHHDAVDAYLDFIFEPAYLDNIAQTTPVEPFYDIAVTKSSANDFARRASSTISFIKYIRDNEDKFCTVSLVNKDIKADDFIFCLQNAALPAFWIKAAKRYLERLMGLKRSMLLQHVVSDETWDSLINDQIFLDIVTKPAILEARK